MLTKEENVLFAWSCPSV